MGYLLYRRRLYWDGRRGVAACDGVYRMLSSPPSPFRDAIHVDYTPEVRCAIIQAPDEAKREMTAVEVKVAADFLFAVKAQGVVVNE
jgi:hypothetical protein